MLHFLAHPTDKLYLYLNKQKRPLSSCFVFQPSKPGFHIQVLLSGEPGEMVHLLKACNANVRT